MKNNVRCRVIGRREELSADIIESIENLEQRRRTTPACSLRLRLITAAGMRLQER